MKKLKSIVIAILLLIPTTSIFAQSTATKKFELYRDNVLLLEHDLGVNINTFKPGGNPAAELMGDRKDVGLREGTRISYLFAPRWGAYLSGFIDFYSIEHPYVDLEGLVKFFFPDVPRLNAEVGMIYRVEHKNWQFYPRFGIGYKYIYHETIGEESYTKHDYGEVDIRPWYMALSVNAAYRVSSLISWVLDVSYHQPITQSKSFIYVSETMDDMIMRNRYDYKTHRWGRDWNISLGIRLNINLGGMKTSKITATQPM